MLPAVGPTSPLDLSVEEFLARLKQHRWDTLAALQKRPWRLNALAVNPGDFWQLFEEAVRHDGTVDLSELGGHAESVAFAPALWRAASAVVGMCLSAYVAADRTTVTMKNTDGVITIDAISRPPMNAENRTR